MTIKDNIIGFIGFALPGGFSVMAFLDQLRPVLGILGLVVSIIVGISVIWLNCVKIKKARLDKKIDEIILKHDPDIDESENFEGV